MAEAERDALKTENERLNGMLTAASWHRAQEEHNALRAELDALVKERDEDRRREYGYSQQVVDALTNERDALRAERDALAEANEAFGKRQVWWDNKMLALEAERDALLSLIADDAFAAAFHTIYWYRRALLKSAKGGGNG